jgi:hypothetical protein
MIQKRKLLSLAVASALVAACGGGGGDTAPIASGTSTTETTTPPAGTPPATPPATGGAPSGGTGTGTPGTTPPSTGSTPTTPTAPTAPATPVADQKFNGNLELAGNQILYLRVNRIIYLPVTLTTFEGSTGIVDVASGSPVANYPNLAAEAAAAGCTIAIDGTCGIQPPAVAPAAPLAVFGIRIGTHILPSAFGARVGAQTVVGRIAFDLTEQTSSPGVGGASGAEIMRFVIDNVEMTTDQDGKLTTVRVREGGQIHVYGRNAAGVEVRESIPAPARTVRLLPLIEIPDSMGDTHSTILLMDLETGFSQAGTRLDALRSIAGHFNMNVTLSHVDKMVRSTAGTAPQKDLIGQSVIVNTQTPVSGGGISGSAWIRMYPM